jgi:hypothetical protein
MKDSKLNEKAKAEPRHHSNVEHVAAPQSDQPGQIPRAAEPDIIEIQVRNRGHDILSEV